MNKRRQLEDITEEASEYLSDKVVTEEQRSEHIERLSKLQEEALRLLTLHENSSRNPSDSGNSSGHSTPARMATSLEMNELATIVKLIPIFTGKKDELQNFVANLTIVSETIPAEKRDSFFNFIHKSRLDLRVQNRLKQDSSPTNIGELINLLRQAYRTQKSSNTVLSELTRIVQKGDNVMGFANKIENLVTE